MILRRGLLDASPRFLLLLGLLSCTPGAPIAWAADGTDAVAAEACRRALTSARIRLRRCHCAARP
jgi:hypothetical protein